MKTTQHTPSCGNVFLDLGFSEEEAAQMTAQAKANTIARLDKSIEQYKTCNVVKTVWSETVGAFVPIEQTENKAD